MCPPYPECIGTGGFWSQDISECTEVGDVNFDASTNILDIVLLVSFILQETYPDNQEFISADINTDGSLDVLDVVEMVDIILQIDL